ncbi:hypothetical protein CAI18_22000 [Xanthomonas citri pv. punicae]|nr:hypothetical protein CAB38_09490 [Xanthomonas citri pv. punicae]QCZ79740.1 hypothetical protein XapB_00535 [Xanthomonas citri pv. punicae]QCZ87267.1 hypothetical protein CAI18_22000 [Xanthomonas citri pv. punicae]QCZ88075.1 hypothetical protein DOO79_01230 [Xanthomonas citri pv. punicae]
MHLHRRDLTWGGVILERVMYFGVSASRRVGRQRHGAGAAQLALAPAKPALRGTRSAPLTANASHLNVHNML